MTENLGYRADYKQASLYRLHRHANTFFHTVWILPDKASGLLYSGFQIGEEKGQHHIQTRLVHILKRGKWR